MAEKKQKHSKGYWLIYKPNHPYRNGQGYVPEARIIMEVAIGRFISPLIEDVHHRDENVQNNELSNLELLTKKEHRRLHNGWKLIDGEWWKVCKGCGKFLKVEGNFYRRKQGHNEYVSQCIVCSYQLSHTKQQHYKKNKERIITCPICGKEKQIPRYAKKQIYCSTKCAWVARRRGK